MENLFPEGYEDLIIEPDDTLFASPTGYKQSVNYSDGDLSRDGQNKVDTANGLKAWEQWCQNCLATERYSKPVYSTDFGIETEEAMRCNDTKKAESILTREIRESLEADPYQRTKSVQSIIFDWKADSLEVSVQVLGIDDATIDITTTIRR
jgi:hypothetical protein